MVAGQNEIKASQRSWLITGGCGFIGTSLIAMLHKVNPKYRIRVLDNLAVGSRDDLAEVCSFAEVRCATHMPFPEADAVQLVVGDIRDSAVCRQCCQDSDVVVHLAANTGVPLSVENPRKDMEVNIIGTFNVLEACRVAGVNKFIFASSGAPLGDVEPPVSEDKVARPISPYGASKLAGEAYCSSYWKTYGVPAVALRFANVYGPRSKHKSSVVAKFFQNALRNEPLEIFGNGFQTRDFIYIDDLLKAVILAARSDAAGEVFQIATEQETTVNEIAAMIQSLVAQSTGSHVPLKYGVTRLGDMKRNYADISKARKMLGFAPDFTLESGLNATLNYYLAEKGKQ